MIASLIALWAAIAWLGIAGPAALDTQKDGPFCEFCSVSRGVTIEISLAIPVAISGYWCWISDHYPISRITCVTIFVTHCLLSNVQASR